MSQTTTEARDQLVADMKAVAEDAEELLRATAGAAGERVSAARARIEERLRAAKDRLAEHEVVVQAKESVKAADDYVRQHPWGAVGIAALAGLLVGVLISRRDRR